LITSAIEDDCCT